MVNPVLYFEGQDKIFFKENKKFIISLLMDGHGESDFTSSYLYNNFYDYFNNIIKIKNKINENELFEKELNETIDHFNNFFINKNEYSGSTIVGFIINKNNKNNFIIFNIGDSRAAGIYNKLNNSYISLSNDHNFFNNIEIKRFQKKELESINLSMTRSLGDIDVKNNYKGVLDSVDIKTYNLNDFSYLLLMSDGVSSSIDDLSIRNILMINNNKKALNIILKECKDNGVDDDKSILIYRLKLI